MLFFKRKKKKSDVKSADEHLKDATNQTSASELTDAETEAAPSAVVEPTTEPEPAADPEAVESEAEPDPAKKPGFFARIKQGLARTSTQFTEGFGNLLLGEKAIDDELLEELETQLLIADIGVDATDDIINSLTAKVARKELTNSAALYRALQ